MPVLDSNIIIDFLRGQPGAIQTVQALSAQGSKLKTTLFNYYEVCFGEIAFEKKFEKINATLTFLDSLEILFPTLTSMKKSAEIRYEIQKIGKTVPPSDLFIAGIILTQNETLYTQNTKHFSEIPEIRVQTC